MAPSPSTARRSSREIGAERCEMPTTRIVMSPPPRSAGGATGPNAPKGCSCGLLSLALLVVGQDLQLDGEVDLAYVDAGADVEHGRREVQDAGDADLDHLVGDGLSGGR